MKIDPELAVFRVVALPQALQSIVTSMGESRKLLREFVTDYETALLAEAVLFERFVTLVQHAAEATSLEDFEARLEADVDKAEALVAAAADDRRKEAEEARLESLKELEQLLASGVLDTESPNAMRLLDGFRKLMDAMPDIAEQSPDEVTFELLFEEKCRELGVLEFMQAMYDEDGHTLS